MQKQYLININKVVIKILQGSVVTESLMLISYSVLCAKNYESWLAI